MIPVACGKKAESPPVEVVETVEEPKKEPTGDNTYVNPFTGEVEEMPNFAEAPVPSGPVDPEDFQTREYRVPPTFLLAHQANAGGAAAADPFADPVDSGNSSNAEVRLSARSALETSGIIIPEGAYANYDPKTGILTVRNSPDQIELVDLLMDSYNEGQEKRINMRVEVFELDATKALRLQQVTAEKADHTAEWQTVNAMLDSGEAKFVTSATCLARSGQRSKVSDVYERIYPTEYEWSVEHKAMGFAFDTREVGTIFEADPVLGADSVTIDLNFQFEHHTAHPQQYHADVQFPNANAELKFPEPDFHAKTITEQIALHTGKPVLIGVWRPTGKPEYAASDVMHVVFLKADIQIVGEAVRIK